MFIQHTWNTSSRHTIDTSFIRRRRLILYYFIQNPKGVAPLASQSCRYKHVSDLAECCQSFHDKTVRLMRQKRSAVLSKSAVWWWLKSEASWAHLPQVQTCKKKKKKVWECFCVEGRKLKTTSIGCKESKQLDFLLKGAGSGEGKKERPRANWKVKKEVNVRENSCNIWDRGGNREECGCVCVCKLMVICLKGWNKRLVVWECFPWRRWPRSSHEQEALKVNYISCRGQNKFQRLMASQHLLPSCLLQFLVNICLGPVNHRVRGLFVCLTVYRGVVFGSELFLQNGLKCKFHFNFANVSTLKCSHLTTLSFLQQCSSGKSWTKSLPLDLFLFLYFLISHNHLRLPQSFPIIFTNLAPLASPKTPSVLGDLCR